MKPAKLRDMTVDELRLEERQLIDQIFRLRLQIAASQVENPARVHILRKDLARVKTILGEKAASGAASAAVAAAPQAPAAPAPASAGARKGAVREKGARRQKAPTGKQREG